MQTKTAVTTYFRMLHFNTSFLLENHLGFVLYLNKLNKYTGSFTIRRNSSCNQSKANDKYKHYIKLNYIKYFLYKRNSDHTDRQKVCPPRKIVSRGDVIWMFWKKGGHIWNNNNNNNNVSIVFSKDLVVWNSLHDMLK